MLMWFEARAAERSIIAMTLPSHDREDRNAEDIVRSTPPAAQANLVDASALCALPRHLSHDRRE
jgi:hypothetical protein